MDKNKIIKYLAYTLIATVFVLTIASRVITFNQIGLEGADATQHFHEMNQYYQSKTLPVLGARFEMGPIFDDSKPKVPGGFFYLHYLVCYTLGGGNLENARVWNLISMIIPVLIFLFWVFKRFGIVAFSVLASATLMNAYFFVTNMSFYNPNLTLTISFLFLAIFGEYVLQKKVTIPAILIFPILAYMAQAHFAVFYGFVPTVIVYMIIRYKKTIKNIKPLLLSVFLAFVSYIPYLAYEIRNDFVNVRKMMSFSSLKNTFLQFPQVHSLFMFPTDEFSVLYTGNTFQKLMAFWTEDNKYTYFGLPVMVLSMIIIFAVLVFVLAKYFKSKSYKFENVYANEKNDSMIILNEMILLFLLYFPVTIIVTMLGKGVSGQFRYHYGAFALSFVPLLYFVYTFAISAKESNKLKQNIVMAVLAFFIINTVAMHTSILSYYKKYHLPSLWKPIRETVMEIGKDADGKEFNIIGDVNFFSMGSGYNNIGKWNEITNAQADIVYYVEHTPTYTNIEGKLIISNQFYVVKRVDR